MLCSPTTCTHSFRKGTGVVSPILQRPSAPGLNVSFPLVPGRVHREPLGRNLMGWGQSAPSPTSFSQ